MSGGGLDLLRARVVLRDRGVADVLDLAVRFVVVHGKLYAKVALASVVPLGLIAAALGWTLGWTLGWAISIPLALVAEIPFTVLASRLVFEDHVRARDVLRAALQQVLRVGFARFVVLVLVVVGLGLLIVPGVFFAAAYLFVGETLLLERASLGQAFARSQRMASSALSETIAGAVVLGAILVSGVVLVDVAGRALVGDLLLFRPPPSLLVEHGSVLATLGLFALVPYVVTARFFLYLDVRTRVEGWDIQTRFAAIAAADASDAAKRTEAA